MAALSAEHEDDEREAVFGGPNRNLAEARTTGAIIPRQSWRAGAWESSDPTISSNI